MKKIIYSLLFMAFLSQAKSQEVNQLTTIDFNTGTKKLSHVIANPNKNLLFVTLEFQQENEVKSEYKKLYFNELGELQKTEALFLKGKEALSLKIVGVDISEKFLYAINSKAVENKKGNAELFKFQQSQNGYEYVSSITLNSLTNSFSISDMAITPDLSIILLSTVAYNSFGNNDIFAVVQDLKGNFSEPINLGDLVNTPLFEKTPYLTDNQQSLYFSQVSDSNTHVLKSVRADFAIKSWHQPQKLLFDKTLTEVKSLGKTPNGFMYVLAKQKGDTQYKIFSFKEDKTLDNANLINSFLALEEKLNQLENMVLGEQKNNNKKNVTLYQLEERIKGIEDNLASNQIEKVEVDSSLVVKNINKQFQIEFEKNSAQLTTEAFALLEEIANYLNNNKGLNAQLFGYTDKWGSKDYNLKLSENRAKACADYLVYVKKVNPKQLTFAGKGMDNKRVVEVFLE